MVAVRSARSVGVALVAVLSGLLAACGSTGGGASGHAAAATPTTVAGPPRTLTVPGQYRTIQAAVDHAGPGDLILVSPGTYHEAVTVDVPDLDIRGLDRSTVVLDGGDTLPNGVTASGDGDVVEDLTVRHYAVNGVLFTKAAYAGSTTGPGEPGAAVLVGYRASYVTAYDNGLYGLYAFGARSGQFDHDYTSGQPDSGVYIGQCDPCDALVTTNVGEHNRVGMEAANASGGLSVVDSTWDANRAGIAVESSTEEQLAPQHGALVAGNVVSANQDPLTPTQAEETDVFGYGIAVGGGSDDVVRDNRVTANATVGILVGDLDGYLPSRDTVTGNVSSGNGVDLAFTLGTGGPIGVAGTCFEANTFARSLPAAIQSRLPCGGAGAAARLVVPALPSGNPPAGVDYTTLPAPPPQPSMPAAATAPAAAATGLGAPPAAVGLPPAGA